MRKQRLDLVKWKRVWRREVRKEREERLRNEKERIFLLKRKKNKLAPTMSVLSQYCSLIKNKYLMWV